ncbi:hypothetical protein TURU_100596 [Turdus rufiventris]|nr:hypothetical protein TURU_100596 [Turdus rufiventris]
MENPAREKQRTSGDKEFHSHSKLKGKDFKPGNEDGVGAQGGSLDTDNPHLLLGLLVEHNNQECVQITKAGNISLEQPDSKEQSQQGGASPLHHLQFLGYLEGPNFIFSTRF